jgi:5'(3')-deoxyribonucleotidase
VIFEFFNDPEFFRTQPVIQGAKEFVRKLSQMTEVFISTSVYPQFMSIRAQRIMEEFPEIPADHIYMGARKDKIDVGINHTWLTRADVEKIHEAGLTVNCWTVDTRFRAMQLVSWGVDYITSNIIE